MAGVGLEKGEITAGEVWCGERSAVLAFVAVAATEDLPESPVVPEQWQEQASANLNQAGPRQGTWRWRAACSRTLASATSSSVTAAGLCKRKLSRLGADFSVRALETSAKSSGVPAWTAGALPGRVFALATI
eukprot:884563-Rhodomonas_salina.1